METNVENLVSTKKCFSRLGWCYLIATAVIYATQLILVKILMVLQMEDLLQNVHFELFISGVTMYLIGFPLLGILLWKLVPSQKPEKKKMSVGQYVLAVIICFGLAYLSNYVGNVISMIIGQITNHPVENLVANLVMDMNPVVILLYMVILAPVMEEFFFRKLIVDRTARYGEWVAVLTSGILFGLFHGNLNQFVYATVIGMFLAYIYLKTGNLKITISMHMLFNFMGGFISSLILKNIDMNQFMQQTAGANEIEAVMEMVLKDPVPWICYGLFVMFTMIIMLAGFVLFVVNAAMKKFTLAKGEIELPKGIRYCILYGNSGMVMFGLFYVIMILRQLTM